MSLRFASSIQGNLGASLDDSRFTGDWRDYGEEEDIIYSDNPLATGLSHGAKVKADGPDEIPSAGTNGVIPGPITGYVCLCFLADPAHHSHLEGA